MFDDAVENLSRIGYTHDEAAFLCLAAAHSGYFVRRQFNDFLRQPRGGAAARFIEKLLGKGHAQVVHFRLNKLIYHIRTLKVYTRLDQADNRNRREKAPLTIKRKLMCLDFVLAHREQCFLRSEAEKIAYFTEARGIPIEYLPVRRYEPRGSGEATLRYFVDKLPVYVSGDDAAPVVHFAYVDEGAESLDGFGTFLNQYRTLFVAVGSFEVVYVAGNSQRPEKARRIFDRRFACVVDDAEARMFQFFEMRRKWEARDFGGFTTEKVIHYREEKQHFCGPSLRSCIVDGLRKIGRRDSKRSCCGMTTTCSGAFAVRPERAYRGPGCLPVAVRKAVGSAVQRTAQQGATRVRVTSECPPEPGGTPKQRTAVATPASGVLRPPEASCTPVVASRVATAVRQVSSHQSLARLQKGGIACPR